MTETPWTAALGRAQRSADFIDLVDSRFHQNHLIPPPHVVEEAFRRWISRRTYEPDSRGLPVAREAVAQFYRTKGMPVEPDQILLTAGTSEAYRLLFTVLGATNDVVAVPQPGYPLFEHLAEHARLKTVTYRQQWSQKWQPSVESVAEAVAQNPRFLVLISPNNPTGQTIDEQVYRQLDSVTPPDMIWIIDEVFDAFSDPARGLPRPAAILPHRRMTTLNGISKRFGSPDLKLSWVVLSGPADWVHETSESLAFVNDAYLSANDFSQHLLPDLFSTSDPWQESVRALLATNKLTAARWMAEQPGVVGILPDGGIHGLWRFDSLGPQIDEESLTVTLLDEARVALHPGFFYDLDEPGIWATYSLLCAPDRFEEGLRRITPVLNSLAGSAKRRR